VVLTVLTFVAAIRCDRVETKKKQELSNKEGAQNSKGRE
jgi:hypothetical protein